MLGILSAAAVLATPIPASTQAAFMGLPIVRTTDVELRHRTVNVRGELDRDRWVVETVSVYKNDSDLEGTARVTVPRYGIEFWGNLGEIESITWSDEPMAFESNERRRANGRTYEGPIGRADTAVWFDHYTATVKPRHTHALKVTVSFPVGKGGLDQLERVLLYDFRTARDARVEHAMYSTRFAPRTIFQTIGYGPSANRWQAGSEGFFVERRNASAKELGLASFRYYPDGFGRIGYP